MFIISKLSNSSNPKCYLYRPYVRQNYRNRMMSTVHKMAEYGFTKGDLYEASRPSYTEQAVDKIIEEFHNIGQKQEVEYDIVELGAGTGKFTRLITKKLRGVRYLATEPSGGFYQTFQELYPDIESLQCTASKIPLKTHSVKCIICAQCFHWFSDAESMNEVKRVLIPDGKLILLWNLKDMRFDWVKTWIKLIREGQPPAPNYYTLDWRTDLDNHGIFRCVHDLELDGVEFGGNIGFLVQNIMSVSVVNALSEEKKEKLKERVHQFLYNVHGDTEYIKIPFKTKIVIYTVK